MIGVDFTRANTTWADGYGRWHALVPAGIHAAHVARRLIRDELTERGEVRRGCVIYLTGVAEHGDLVEYAEKS